MDQNVSTAPHKDDASKTVSPDNSVNGRRRLRSTLMVGGALALAVIASVYGYQWWTVGQFQVSTDDAYLQADSVTISPEVSGYIAAALVQDNQRVRAGQVLARIDDRDYRTALAAAQANTAAAAAEIGNLQQQIAQQNYVVSEAHASVAGDLASLAFAAQNDGRYARLARSGAGTEQDAQQAVSTVQEKRATLQHDTAAVGVAATQLSVLNAQLVKAQAALAQQQAALRQSELNLGYTVITAPIDGVIGERSLRPGQYVQTATPLMAVVPLQSVYIVANYKETQLTDVRPGQRVVIDVDTFPGQVVHGVVNSIAPASGAEFTLLPADNATGNFTKIVQRVPVKITIDANDPLRGQLRPGMSVEPVIDTRSRG